CPATTTSLSDIAPGGTWSSSNSTVATVSPGGGVVYGTTTGTTVITYSASGCSATTTVTVATLPAITGNTSICAGQTTQLSDATSGGVWSSANSAVATVSGTGLVSGSTSGSASIIYTLGGC